MQAYPTGRCEFARSLLPTARSRRGLLGASVLISVFLALTGCGGGGHEGGRVIVLGFDGMDYGLTQELMAEGRLPNFSKLAEQGSFARLETSVPPESPVAWSNFTTGMDAGGHGIFDFVHRDPQTLLPFPSDRQVGPEGLSITLGKYKFPLTGGDLISLRHGTPFWSVLEEHGIESWILRMPANFPTSELATRELSGMGTDDLRGTPGFFSFYTSELFYPTQDITGGEVYEWDVIDGVAEQKIFSADNPLLVEPERLAVPFKVYVDSEEPLAKIVIDEGEEVVLAVGEWSGWVPLDFELVPTQNLGAIGRFYLKAVRPELELYLSPLNFDPMAPAAPIATPLEYATELAEATGRFFTQGMPEDTKAWEDKVMDLDWFVGQAAIAGSEVRDQYDYVLDTFDGGLLFYYMGNVDQTSHVLWASMDPEHPQYTEDTFGKYRDLIPSLYVELDEVVGQTMQWMRDDDLLVVMSDHGFASWRRVFNLNTWLVENGYMALKDPNLSKDPGFFGNVDWSRTKAYGMGLNGLYINLEGREKNGVVKPSERAALMDQLERDLLASRDPETGSPVVTKVYQREEIYEFHDHIDIGPDIQMGYAKGYRGSGKGALGTIEPDFLRDNTEGWTGDHIMDHETVPGVLFSSRPLAKPASHLEDLAASILAEFEIDEPFPGREQ